MIRLQTIENCTVETWDNTVASFKGGSVFHTLPWMQATEQLSKAKMLPVGIENRRMVPAPQGQAA